MKTACFGFLLWAVWISNFGHAVSGRWIWFVAGMAVVVALEWLVMSDAG